MTQATVATYLIERLKQAGLKHCFGVPGDYVLTFMDRLIEGGVDFVGTCNELNAGYAADAYARINGIGCICVTWGVGAFSAMNAVAGAYAEQVPLVILVGGPRTTQLRSAMLLLFSHHCGLCTARRPRRGAAAHRSCARSLHRGEATDDDRDSGRYGRSPLRGSGPFAAPSRATSDPDALAEALDEAMELLLCASRPVILGGVELHRYGLMREFRRLVEASRIPVATTLLGKTVISEHHPKEPQRTMYISPSVRQARGRN